MYDASTKPKAQAPAVARTPPGLPGRAAAAGSTAQAIHRFDIRQVPLALPEGPQPLPPKDVARPDRPDAKATAPGAAMAGSARAVMHHVTGRESAASARSALAESHSSGLYALKQRPNRTGLPDALKTDVERTSGLSMDDLRVRYRSSEPERFGALAFAQGRDIHLGPGQERHLPHEAWHVVQQARGRVAPQRLFKGSHHYNVDPALEREADQFSRRSLPNNEPPSPGVKRVSLFSNTMQFTFGDLVKTKNYMFGFMNQANKANDFLTGSATNLINCFRTPKTELSDPLSNDLAEKKSMGLRHSAAEISSKAGGFLFQALLQAETERETGATTVPGASNNSEPDFYIHNGEEATPVEVKTTAQESYSQALAGGLDQLSKRDGTNGQLSIQLKDFESVLNLIKNEAGALEKIRRMIHFNQMIRYNKDEIKVEFRDFMATLVLSANFKGQVVGGAKTFVLADKYVYANYGEKK